MSISMRASMARLGLCYCCNELGICSPFALSPRSTGRSSCMGSCPLPPHPLASSARSVQLRMWRDWPTSPGATCQSTHAGSLPLCAGTMKERVKTVRASAKFNKEKNQGLIIMTHFVTQILHITFQTPKTHHNMKLMTYLPGFDQRPSAVHIILRVHDKNHLVSVQFKSTVQTPGVLHTQLAVPLSPAAHRLHLPHLPAAETTQVPTKRHV